MMRLLHEEGCDCYPHPEKTYPHEILALLQKCKRLTTSGEFYRLEKDHEGEREFAKILFKELHQPYITLYGIMLEHNESHFQIDYMIISQGTIYLIDIKYFSQEYYYHNDDFYLIKTKEKTDNPLHQLEHCKGLLHKLLKKHNFHYKIESYVLFLHPEFTLFAAPIHEKVMLRSQVPRFMRKLNQQYMQITAAEQLLRKFIYAQHREKAITDAIEIANYDQLKKEYFVCSAQACSANTGEMGVWARNCSAQPAGKQNLQNQHCSVQSSNLTCYFQMNRLLRQQSTIGVQML